MTFTTITDLINCIEAHMGVLDEEIGAGRDSDRESAEAMAQRAWDLGVRDEVALADLWPDRVFNAVWAATIARRLTARSAGRWQVAGDGALNPEARD